MALPLLIPSAEPPRRETLLARLGLTPNVAVDRSQQLFAPPGSRSKPAPAHSPDLTRVVALPRRPVPSLEEQQRLADALTAHLALPAGPCRCAELRPAVVERGLNPCIRRLNPVQGWHLAEAAEVGGVLGHVVAGGGKTGIDILLPVIEQEARPRVDADGRPRPVRAVLLIPPDLRAQFALDYQTWRQHFRVPNLGGGSPPFAPDRPTLFVMAYSELSHKRWATALAALRPDIIIADEGQACADTGATRTHRLLSYYCENEGIGFYVHSGTLTVEKLEDYSHLSAMALRDGSPLPVEPHVAEEWGGVIDAGPDPAPIGALASLCEPGESARSGFRRRLTQTPGVVVTADAQLATRLLLRERHAGALPGIVREALDYVRSGERPDTLAGGPFNEELVEALEVATVARQVSCGFFYRWRYPRGEPLHVIEEWFHRRQAWFRALREKLTRRRPLLDSPSLCEDAARRHFAREAAPDTGAWDARIVQGVRQGDLPRWDEEAYPPWVEYQSEVQPEGEAVWLDDWLARDAVAWAREAPGIVWYAHTAFGRRVAELGGLPFYGGGAEASAQITQERGDRSIVASIKAHHKGKNLQHAFWRNLVANMPDKRGVWEQLLARTHRQGQPRDEVEGWLYRHTPEVRESFEGAVENSEYVFETTGKQERLLYAVKEWEGA